MKGVSIWDCYCSFSFSWFLFGYRESLLGKISWIFCIQNFNFLLVFIDQDVSQLYRGDMLWNIYMNSRIKKKNEQGDFVSGCHENWRKSKKIGFLILISTFKIKIIFILVGKMPTWHLKIFIKYYFICHVSIKCADYAHRLPRKHFPLVN